MNPFDAQVVEDVIDKHIAVFFALGVVNDPLVMYHSQVRD